MTDDEWIVNGKKLIFMNRTIQSSLLKRKALFNNNYDVTFLFYKDGNGVRVRSYGANNFSSNIIINYLDFILDSIENVSLVKNNEKIETPYRKDAIIVERTHKQKFFILSFDFQTQEVVTYNSDASFTVQDLHYRLSVLLKTFKTSESLFEKIKIKRYNSIFKGD
jgi:hypothetical protein